MSKARVTRIRTHLEEQTTVAVALNERPGMKLWRIPLDVDKFSIPHGEIHIITSRCKGCELCVRYCPKDVLVMSEGMNEKGYHPPEAIRPEQCVACRLCELLCPEFCIYVREVVERE